MASPSRTDRLAAARLYLVLTRALCRKPWADVVSAAVRGGAAMVQIREKDMADGALLAHVLEVRRVVEGTGVLVVVNDRPDLAVLADADGAHVGQDDADPSEARRLLGDARILGVSTHDAAQRRRAVRSAADHCGFGPVFDTATKGLSGIGLRDWADEDGFPTFAIGGIGPGNVAPLAACGVRRIAVSSALCAAEDPEAVARTLLERLRAP